MRRASRERAAVAIQLMLEREDRMSRVFNVLVLCTGNSARSILGEMLFKHLGKGRIKAWSAGSKPGGQVNPVALETLAKHGVPVVDARSKSWDEFAVPSAPALDFIFTVCGNADQACPMFPGQVNRYHWPFDDPAHATGTEEEKFAVFRRVRDEIRAVFEAYAAGCRDESKRRT